MYLYTVVTLGSWKLGGDASLFKFHRGNYSSKVKLGDAVHCERVSDCPLVQMNQPYLRMLCTVKKQCSVAREHLEEK